MFGSMGKNCWGLQVSFFMDWKVASKEMGQVCLFHTTILSYIKQACEIFCF